MHAPPSIVVFCDLDETLFQSHRFVLDQAACDAFHRIERQHVPVVFCSTRTRAELELIQQELGISHPFICENGGAAYIPRGYFGAAVAQVREFTAYEVIEFGKTHAELVALLHRTAARVNVAIVGFSDMSVEDVAVECGVSLLQARLMKLREYSEQIRIIDERDGTFRLLRALAAANIEYRRLGRCHHVGGRRGDIASQFVRRLYERAFGEIRAVAFGDHPGAAALLRRADLPLIVRSDASEQDRHLQFEVPAARISVIDSHSAWADMVLEIAEIARVNRASCTS